MAHPLSLGIQTKTRVSGVSAITRRGQKEIPESSANLLFPVFKQLISISKGLIRHVIASLPLFFLLSVGRSSVKEPILIQSTTDSLPNARD
jgi:hypothetical protein